MRGRPVTQARHVAVRRRHRIEVAAAAVPVREHPALAVAPVDDAAGGARDGACDRGSSARRPPRGTPRRRREDRRRGSPPAWRRWLRGSCAAATWRRRGEAHRAARGSARRQRGIARDRAVPLVGDIAGAELVAVEQQRRRARDVDDDALGEQRRSGGAAKRSPEEDVAVAGHDADGHAGGGDVAQCRGDVRRQRFAQLVVADPGVEEVAEDVDRRGAARRDRAERVERRDQRRPRRRQVQVGDEQRGLLSESRSGRASARSPSPLPRPRITTSSFGTFWWKPLLPSPRP